MNCFYMIGSGGLKGIRVFIEVFFHERVGAMYASELCGVEPFTLSMSSCPKGPRALRLYGPLGGKTYHCLLNLDPIQKDNRD